MNYCYGFMPSNFQITCGSMVGENCQSLASTETPGLVRSGPYRSLQFSEAPP